MDLGTNLSVSGTFVVLTGFAVGLESYKLEDSVFKKITVSAASLLFATGGIMISEGLDDMIGNNGVNKLQEISEYVSSLSDEELESLSEDLVETDISDTDIENVLDYRINLLSENNDEFSSDEYRELLQKSVVDYLDELRTSDFEEYNKIMDLLSEGDYNDGDIPKEFKKNIIIKKMNF